MSLTSKFRHQGVVLALTFLLIIASICAVFGQDPLKNDDLVFQSKNADGEIILSSLLNFTSKALPLNGFINSHNAELSPAVTPQGNRLYFGRAFSSNNTGREKDPSDIWYTEFNAAEDTWTQSIRLPGILNTAEANCINSVSVTGDTILYSSTIVRKKEIEPLLSYSVNIDGKWSEPIPIQIANHYNRVAKTESCVSMKTGVIVMSVKRDDTFGERDLYVSFWDGEHATEPINMGAVLNTKLDESTPFFSADLKTLYFASKGQSGYGGYDVFASQRLDNSWTNWTKPENLGEDINTSKDEEYFMIATGQKFAFFTRQIDGKNTDIFRISVDDVKSTSFR